MLRTIFCISQDVNEKLNNYFNNTFDANNLRGAEPGVERQLTPQRYDLLFKRQLNGDEKTDTQRSSPAGVLHLLAEPGSLPRKSNEGLVSKR